MAVYTSVSLILSTFQLAVLLRSSSTHFMLCVCCMKCSTSCYPAAILLLSCCYPAAILLLSCCYPAAILLLSCCYPAAILLLSCCYPAAILLLSWSPQLTLTTCALVIHHPEETYSYCFAAKQQWQCTRWYTWCISVKSGGTPDFTLHNRWYTYCGIAALA